MSAPSFSVPDQIPDIDLRRFLLMLWRRKWIMYGSLVVGLVLTILIVSMLPVQYSAKTLVLLEPSYVSRTSVPETQIVLNPSKTETSLVLSELEVIRSTTLAREVVRRLNLVRDPEFNRALRSSHSWGRGAQVSSFRPLSVQGDTLGSIPAETIDAQMADIIARFQEGLRVRLISGSHALQIEYTALTPAKAARIANTIADIYIEQRLDSKFQFTKKTTEWLDKRLETLRGQVRAHEEAAARYRARHNLAEGKQALASAEQFSQLNAQLALAKTQRAAAEAKLEHIRSFSSAASLESLPEFANSRLLGDLKLQEAKLDADLTKLSSRYGERHPEMIKRRGELEELRRSIGQEMDKIRGAIASELELAQTQVETLEQGVAEISGRRNEDDEAMIRLRELEREAQASRLIYDTFLETYKRSDEQEELQEAEARILSYAAAPRAPSAPNVPLLFILGGILSLFAGLILSVIAEKMDNACRDPEQLEALGYPCYGMVPVVRGVRAPRLARYTLANPASDAAEAVRTLRMSMNLRAFKGEQKARVLSLTSSFAAEGKTTLSLWLARMAARAGERVIIIDTDLRAPAIHRAMGVRNNSTLVDYLSGQKELSQVIYQDRETGLHMIFGASVPNTALDLVNSPRMRGLIEELRGSYDLVILDTPACLPVSDSRVMASLSDLVFYIVAWDQTARGAITAGIKQFADIGIENMAFVFTHVDMRRHAREHYGTAQRYYRSYKGQGA